MRILADHITPRLRYMARWLGENLVGHPLPVTTDRQSCEPGSFILNYTAQPVDQPGIHLSPCGLLGEFGVRDMKPRVAGSGKEARIFPGEGELGFDLLGAAFYLLTRYEEYLPHREDEYGRYHYENSLAWQHGFLKYPLLDSWMKKLREIIQEKWPEIRLLPQQFSCQPSFDVDIAWAVRHRPKWMEIAQLSRERVLGGRQAFAERKSVLQGDQPDEADIFDDLLELHESLGQKPLFFVLAAARRKGYDRNIPRDKQAFIQLQKKLNATAITGMHLSWAASENEKTMQQEQNYFRTTLGEESIRRNRMHYLNFSLPATYRQLLLLNTPVAEDYSMGYGNINGFRASTSLPFYWFDLEAEKETGLKIVPFCWMDANSIFEQGHSPAEAAQELQFFHDVLKACDGLLITLAHNHMMGRSAGGRKWWSLYETFYQLNFTEYAGRK